MTKEQKEFLRDIATTALIAYLVYRHNAELGGANNGIEFHIYFWLALLGLRSFFRDLVAPFFKKPQS